MYLKATLAAFFGGKRNSKYVSPSSGNRINVALAAFLRTQTPNADQITVAVNEIVARSRPANCRAESDNEPSKMACL